MNKKYISVKGARENNLKNVSVEIPRDKLVVLTGVSGCGKSSLAFDVVYAEGSRRYMDSFSNYARRGDSPKPDFDEITNLSPAIAIQQRGIFKNPRSTVATITEIYDYLRVLFASIGVPYSKATGLPIRRQSQDEIIELILALPTGSEINIVAHILPGQDIDTKRALILLRKYGAQFAEIDDVRHPIDQLPLVEIGKDYKVSGIFPPNIMRVSTRDEEIVSLIKIAFRFSNGILSVLIKKSSIQSNIDEFLEKYRSFLSKDDDSEYFKLVFSEQYVCTNSNISITKIEPRMFSFNSPNGVCKKCGGLGLEPSFSPELIVRDASLTIKEGAISAWHRDDDNRTLSSQQQRSYDQLLEALASHLNFCLDVPYRALPQKIKNIIMYGSEEEMQISYNDGYRTRKVKMKFEGVIKDLQNRFQNNENRSSCEDLEKYQVMKECNACNGYRLSQEALCIYINEKNIGEVCAMSIRESIEWFDNLKSILNSTEKQIADRTLFEIIKRLNLVANMGLGYLTLNRRTISLSGGETQRTKLATQIGSGLSGIIYVLDEPSTGLHPADNALLIEQLVALRDLGNTVIVVEHDEDTIRIADHIIDLGPGAGAYGGEIVATGDVESIMNNPNSITGMYLSGRQKISKMSKNRDISNNPCIEIRNANTHNLKNISTKIQLGGLIAVSGPSGSGKSSFVLDTLYLAAKRRLNSFVDLMQKDSRECDIIGLENINKIIEVDQSAIGKTPRSNPVTYTNIFTLIRDLYANLPESKLRGYNVGRFSFNVRGGRCEKCEGDGSVRIEMYFMSDVHCICDECGGSRYNEETLKVKYKGKSIADVLQMSVSEANEFFHDVQPIKEKLEVLDAVGLGYIKLGQNATQLSGGEAQRLKLSKELLRKSGTSTLYIFDEPTTGLHMHDIQKLIAIFERLIENNHSILVIEHNLEILKIADWIIDFGPHGGDRGGYIVAEGTPEFVAKNCDTLTSRYLRPFFS